MAPRTSRALSDRDAFLKAMRAAAPAGLRRSEPGTEARAFTPGLVQSRARLVEAAHAERRRLERDLHDGVQQDLLALRIKLDVAAAAIRADPAEGERLVTAAGREMDHVLQALRAFARGIYPAVLQQRGLPDALRAAARSSPECVSVRAFDVGRYPEDIEVGVYFCCLEALQNVAKHAGPDARVTVKLSERARRLHFEVRDFGRGFDMHRRSGGSGLSNMRDRIEAIGGDLVISSAHGLGTTVSGSLAVAERPAHTESRRG
jgi:signal transduction histidine kinase